MARASSRLGFALASSVALVPSYTPASAQDTETWHCNAPYGHYNDHVIDITGKTVITGRINMHSADIGSEWASTGRVMTQDSRYEGAPCSCAGVVASGFKDPANVDFALSSGDSSEHISTRHFETPITFRIEFDPHGQMTVQIGKDHPYFKSITLAHPRRDVLELSCSGADVSFLNIEAH